MLSGPPFPPGVFWPNCPRTDTMIFFHYFFHLVGTKRVGR